MLDFWLELILTIELMIAFPWAIILIKRFFLYEYPYTRPLP